MITVENVSKRYRAGTTTRRTLRDDLTRWWSRFSNQPDSFPKEEIETASNSRDNEIWALQDISFEVQQGEVLGIIGRKGAGKSTLLKILSHITAPTTGLVKINGRISSLLEVGSGFNPEMTGRDNVFLSGALLGMTQDEVRKKFDEIMDFAGVQKFIDTPIKRFSDAMYVRLAFAVAFHLQSEILVVDEVLTVSDAEFQQKCLEKMAPAELSGRTLIFVSNNMAAIQRLCNRVMLLELGKAIRIAEPASVIDQYQATISKPSTYWHRETQSSSDIFFDQVYLTNGNQERIHQVTTSTSINIVMDFTIAKPTSDLMLGITIYDAQRNGLFSSAPQDNGLEVVQQPGTYRYVAALPENILMPQTYTIKPVLWSEKAGVYDEIDTITFPVVETESPSNDLPGGRIGSLAVLCDWKRDR